MWQNNEFGNFGNFQNIFNQDEYIQSTFAETPVPALAARPFFQQHLHQPHLIEYEEGNNGESYTANGFQPELGSFNDGAFMQNQFANQSVPFLPPHFNFHNTSFPTTPRISQINARAAELKAQLLKGKEGRGISATPPLAIPGLVMKHASDAEDTSSLHGSSKSPDTTVEEYAQELNLNELISQYSESKQPKDTTSRQDKETSDPTASNLRKPLAIIDQSAKSQTPSLGSPTRVAKRISNGQMVGEDALVRNLGTGRPSTRSVSDTSNGAIEDPAYKNALLPTKTKQNQILQKPVDTDQPAIYKLKSDQNHTSHFNGSREESPHCTPTRNTNGPSPRGRDDRPNEIELVEDDDPSQSSYIAGQKNQPGSEKTRRSRWEVHEGNDEFSRNGANNEQKREAISKPSREQIPPSLAQPIPYNEDLREWLEITGYHNAPYRNKILNRRRAIAALDRQRNKLLAEMEAEERGGLPVAIVGLTASPALLPPQIHNKVEDRSNLVVETAIAESQRDRVVPKKRSYCEIQEQRDDSGLGKAARVEDRGQGPGKIEEEEPDLRRPKSSSLDSPHQSSGDRADEKHVFDSHNDKGRGRGPNPDGEISPGLKAYESRPLAPHRSSGSGSIGFPDRDERPERTSRNPRPFEVHGGYRGRAYDPNYRGRGRGGRGRGDSYGYQEQKNDSAFKSDSAVFRPYKNRGGFHRGGKGGTRYFIVKSFNDQNVVRCIEDSVWNTQIQNGSIFKEAFETCKNVILVFSINRSGAFQGYARMESLPGSVEVPSWQNTIVWETAGAFKVKWLVVCPTRFSRVCHLKNSLNEGQTVFVGKDGQEIEEHCATDLIDLIDEECDLAL